MPIILVGEDNPLSEDPRMALYHFPPHASGGRLRRILGLSERSYLRLAKRSLCRGTWSAREAREAAQELLADTQWSPIVMLGANVRRAFGVDQMDAFSAQGVLVSLPHPSGRCRVWNLPSATAEARELLRRVAPDVPWGEEDLTA